MRRAWFVILAACGSNSCVGPDAGATERYPGPCTASAPDEDVETVVCRYTYDEQDRLVATSAHTLGLDQTQVDATYTYDGDALVGATLSVGVNFQDCYVDTWVLDSTPIQRTRATMDGLDCFLLGDDGVTPATWTYETEQFALDGMFTCGPSAETSVTERLAAGITTTFTYDGPPRVGARTRTETEDGTVVGTRVFRYDADARLVGDEDGEGRTRQLTYDEEGNLVTETITDASTELVYAYHYDEPGNLLFSEYTYNGDGPFRSRTYDYSCW